MKRVFVLLVVVSFVCPQTLLAAGPGPLREAIARAARTEVAAQSARRGENPRMVPGLVLIGGGATLATLALIGVGQSVDCESDDINSPDYLNCGTHKSKALLFGGLGAAAVGGILILTGEGQRGTPSRTFAIVPQGRHGVAAQVRLRY